MLNLRKVTLGILVSGIFALGGCSSSSTKDADLELGDEVPVAEATTDAIPPAADQGELPPPEAQAEQPAPDALPAPEASPEPTPQEQFAEAPPAPPADVPPPAEAPAPPAPEMAATAESHVVRGGDTLMKIAFEAYGDIYAWKKIYEANRDVITDPNNIPKGVTLKLEGASHPQPEQNGERYQVKKGDTLGKISAQVYGTPSRWKDIWENNKQLIKDPNKIYAGFYVYYQPQGQPMAAAPASQQAPTEARMPAAANAAPVAVPESNMAPPADVPAAQ